MKFKDFYPDIIKENVRKYPDPSLGEYLLQNKIEIFNGYLYHGTPLDGLKSMLIDGIWGTQHGELSEYDTFSTSINSEVLSLFSERDGVTGLGFKVNNIRVLIIDDILAHLATREGGSGIDFDFDEDVYEEFCKKFNIPRNNRDYYFPYNYLSSLGVDAVCYEYAWKAFKKDRYHQNDETEICFFPTGFNKLNSMIDDIYVINTSYDISDKEKALEEINYQLSDE